MTPEQFNIHQFLPTSQVAPSPFKGQYNYSDLGLQGLQGELQ